MMLLSINNPNYPNWIALIYPNEYKITEKASSFPFLYIYRTFDTISQPFLPDYIKKRQLELTVCIQILYNVTVFSVLNYKVKDF
jgi:hypothetical protein